MMQVDPVNVKTADDRDCLIGGPEEKKPLKRKRVNPKLHTPSPEEKNLRISELRNEINSLIKFYQGLISEKGEALQGDVGILGNSSASLNAVIARLLEESDLPLSKLVNEIYEKVKVIICNGDGITRSIVKSSVVAIGQRLSYGAPSAEADVLEDESEVALWCWETRDLKLFPKSARASLKVRRNFRKKIHERIEAIAAMINTLEKPETNQNWQLEVTRAAQKLSKVLKEAQIRLLMENMSQKSGAEIPENELKRDEKVLIKQMEKSEKELEKERKRLDKELQKEKLLSEKEMKRLKDEAEKEQKRREKEEHNMQKQLKKQQEEAEKEQKRKEKEEAESRKKLALQKQASILERFLKRKRSYSTSPEDSSVKNIKYGSSLDGNEKESESVILSMDIFLAKKGQVELENIWRSHLDSWHSSRRSKYSSKKVHWGVRQKPKTELVKELKLSTNNDYLNMEKLLDGWVEPSSDRSLSSMNSNSNTPPRSQKGILIKQLLQFDKSNRPAFYGVCPQKSQVVGARHPFVKDPDIDYEIDSDDEWEEDEPGESLSDVEKDDDDGNMEENMLDEEDESEDGFFVPDGYLSEDEGVNKDDMEDGLVEELGNRPSPKTEEFCSPLLRQQKYLCNLTEHALKKNRPLVILNLKHEKSTFLSADELSGTEKLERMCLQALSVRPLCSNPSIEISVQEDMVDNNQDASPNMQSASSPVANASAILDDYLPQIISVIQSAPCNIVKLVELLHDKFPGISKTQLRNKVREVSEYCDNRWQWQVKREFRGLSVTSSPEEKTTKLKTKSISTFLKRCMPPTNAKFSETSPDLSVKTSAGVGVGAGDAVESAMSMPSVPVLIPRFDGE